MGTATTIASVVEVIGVDIEVVTGIVLVAVCETEVIAPRVVVDELPIVMAVGDAEQPAANRAITRIHHRRIGRRSWRHRLMPIRDGQAEPLAEACLVSGSISSVWDT